MFRNQTLYPQGADAGVPPPEQSHAFYAKVFDYARAHGAVGYEVDFMSNLFLSVPEFRRTLDASAGWQSGLNTAAIACGVDGSCGSGVNSELDSIFSSGRESIVRLRLLGLFSLATNMHQSRPLLLACGACTMKESTLCIKIPISLTKSRNCGWEAELLNPDSRQVWCTCFDFRIKLNSIRVGRKISI